MATIIIGGDLCPIGKNRIPFENGDSEAIFNELLNEFKNSDITLVNLECPLITQESPIPKVGPILSAPENCITGIKNAHIDTVNLSNNHIMDHGGEGLLNTIATCSKNKIATVGAGVNIQEARKMLIRNIDDIRVGIVAFTEHEFSVATKDSPGANPLDIIDCLRNIRSNEGLFDYLILLIHGGKELYPYPTPGLMNTCRFFAEEVADAIICQHSHCPVCHETYNGVHIVYGQGNLVFEGGAMCDETWNEGFLVRLKLSKDGKSKMDLLPYVQAKDGYGVRMMCNKEERSFITELENRSVAIQDLNFVYEQWIEFCKINKYKYLSLIRGHGRLRNYINRKIHLSDFTFSLKSRRQILNVVRCETHREILETILKS